MKHIKILSLCIASFFLISGCVTKIENEDVLYYYPTDDVAGKSQAKLSEAAVSVSDSLNKLAAIEKATHPRAKLSPPLNPYAVGLSAPASVDWTGPVEPLVQKLAHAGHYKFRVVGKNPAIPVLVAVYATNVPLSDILRDANFQAGKKADIVIYPSRRIIELRYRNL